VRCSNLGNVSYKTLQVSFSIPFHSILSAGERRGVTAGVKHLSHMFKDFWSHSKISIPVTQVETSVQWLLVSWLRKFSLQSIK